MIKPTVHRGLICVAMVMMLAGCSRNDRGNEHMLAAAESSMVPIKVELSWSPEDISANDKVTFTAVVTQDGDPVDDAKEVMFEIVDTADSGKITKLEGTSNGDGSYSGDNIFEQAGKYKVTSHVTARTQHSMPTKELVVQP